jgi:hypothetical protein
VGHKKRRFFQSNNFHTEFVSMKVIWLKYFHTDICQYESISVK